MKVAGGKNEKIKKNKKNQKSKKMGYLVCRTAQKMKVPGEKMKSRKGGKLKSRKKRENIKKS